MAYMFTFLSLTSNCSKHSMMFDCSEPLAYKKCDKCRNVSFDDAILKRHKTLKCRYPVRLFIVKECKTCPFTTHSELIYLSHVMSKDKYCHFYWEFRKDLNVADITQKSIAAIDDTYWFRCGVCERFLSANEHDIVRHIEHAHESYTFELVKWWACDLCDYKKKLRYQVLTHINTKHTVGKEIKWFKCSKCDYKTKRSSSLSKHNSGNHALNRKVTWHQCQRCSYRCKMATNLRMHIERKHTITGLVLKTCSICGCRCRDLKGHMRYKHDPGAKITWFKCALCSFKTRSKRDLDDHTNANHTESATMKWYYCDKCLFKSNKQRALKAHFDSNHHGRSEVFKCDQCDYETNLKKWLVRHIYFKHTPDDQIKWFKCEFCEHKSKTSGNLKLHVKGRHLKKLETGVPRDK